MTDLVDFLRARLDEDERVAQSCPQAHWSVSGPPSGHYAHSATSSYLGGWTGTNSRAILANPTSRAGGSLTHAARHDPARVLREVEAKRRVLDRHHPEAHLRVRDGKYVPEDLVHCPDHLDDRPWPCADVLNIASVYADHPDYNESWRP